jgi:uncharacterized SAM-binding protein YcdF (DUF218 family)
LLFGRTQPNHNQDLREEPTEQVSLVSNHSKAAREKHAPSVVCRLDRDRAFAGLLVRKQCWSLSLRGKLLVLLVLASAAVSAFLNLYPFLAVTHRVDTNVLVVEGWVHKYAIRSAVEEFRAGSYQRVFTTGGPVIGSGGYSNDYNTAASVGADLLKELGLPTESVQMAPSHVADRERTYSAAIALRDWFRDHNTAVHSFNVLTEDFHARRTRLLFRKAFGEEIAIGIIAVPNPDYHSKRWWRYSDGVREALGESVAYIYATCFFHPAESSQHNNKLEAPQASR